VRPECYRGLAEQVRRHRRTPTFGRVGRSQAFRTQYACTKSGLTDDRVAALNVEIAKVNATAATEPLDAGPSKSTFTEVSCTKLLTIPIRVLSMTS
jgi:hypothetical protein